MDNLVQIDGNSPLRTAYIEMLITRESVGASLGESSQNWLAQNRISAARPELDDFGCSPEDRAEIRSSLLSFEEDWDAPGMEAYDSV